MGTCKVCGGAIFASNEVVGYSGPICNNPMHLSGGQAISTDTVGLWQAINEIRTKLMELELKIKPPKKGKL